MNALKPCCWLPSPPTVSCKEDTGNVQRLGTNGVSESEEKAVPVTLSSPRN